jgi:hypothetical protein
MAQPSGEESSETLSGEVLEPAEPAYGTLAWLALKPHVILMGRELPACHRVPEGASWRTEEERGSRCALMREDGSTCAAPATKRYGLCIRHSGGGADPGVMSPLGVAKLGRLKVQRELLGIGPRGMANPRALARLGASERAAEVAEALLAPLSARGLTALERQAAARIILGETFPLSTATVEVELPAQAGEVEAMGWAELQALAGRLLTSADQ